MKWKAPDAAAHEDHEDDQSATPGRLMFVPLIEPIFTKRIGTPSWLAFAAATSNVSALVPHR